MKKKLQEKKGFTLVELMIVVVIMGILVAVAIPVYNSATKNTKVKTCAANVKIVEENLSSYIMQGNAGEEFTFAQIVADFGATATGDKTAAITTDKWPAAFQETFKDGIPTCPFNKSNTAAYTITFEKTSAGGISYTVTCEEQAHKDAVK